MQEVPIQAVPAQTFSVLLEDQQVQLTLRQLSTGLFVNVALNDAEVVGMVVCENLNLIIRNKYFGFSGDFMFFDTTGAGDDPYYSGLGERFILLYVPEDELPTNKFAPPALVVS